MKTYKETLDLMNDFANGIVHLNKMSDSDLSNIIVVLEEIQQYRAVGTVEECRAAVEKMKPKKPIKKDGIRYCPCCGEIPSTDTGDSFVDYYVPYCLDCGQHIDLED